MKKILVIEDDREINNLVCEFLSENGYETVSARDGITGLRKFENEKSVDLVILDLMLPYKSGDGVLSEIRRMSNIPVIVTSAKDMIQTKVDIMRLGADDYITKPFDLDVLTAKVQAILRRSYDFGTQTSFIEHKGAILNMNDGNTVLVVIFCIGQSSCHVFCPGRPLDGIFEKS